MTDLIAVADTNIVVSAALSPNSIAGLAFLRLRRSAKLIATDETLAELRDVLMREKFARIGPAVREETLRFYGDIVTIMKPSIDITACRHPKDDKFLSLAVSGAADLILTGDNDLLVLHPFRGIDILSPRTYLETHA